MSDKTEIPVRSLVAYAEAELSLRVTDPACNITWATLAGVGRVESHHGSYGGSRVGEDGTLTPPIVGIPLDGSPGVLAIPDTDGGRLDGDAQWDRAVGAMQFLPATWARWGVRAGGDGAAPDPQNIDDAALSRREVPVRLRRRHVERGGLVAGRADLQRVGAATARTCSAARTRTRSAAAELT